jgi:NAD(P)-dependent dehydrogenase (short-subunit alcohol dehydrogenase family)
LNSIMGVTEASQHVALVTGGAKRIGRTISLVLARNGYNVAIHCNRSKDEAQSLKAEIEAAGGRAAILVADLTDSAAAAQLVPNAARVLGPLTLLVNNASIFEQDEIGTLELKNWQRQFAINLTTPVFLAQAFAAQAANGSAIVNLLDQRVLKTSPLFFSYALTKSALHDATRTLAQALAPRIRVNGVAPGPTLPSYRQTVEDFARQSAKMPLGHGGSPEEIAEAVLFLARARSITGAILPVDGGQHIAWETPDMRDVRE